MFAISLVAYTLFLLVFTLLSFFALYQLWQFGYVGDASRRVIVGYTMVCGLLILVSVIAIVLAIS